FPQKLPLMKGVAMHEIVAKIINDDGAKGFDGHHPPRGRGFVHKAMAQEADDGSDDENGEEGVQRRVALRLAHIDVAVWVFREAIFCKAFAAIGVKEKGD